MVSRRQLREYALQALYQCDTVREFRRDLIDLYFTHFHSSPLDVKEGDDDADPLSFAKSLALGVLENLTTIDGFIAEASEHWSIDRMSRVDRNILRIGVLEIVFIDDIPINVSINEAIEIAKRYGADDSPIFVNGVLDRVASDLRERKEGRHAPLRKVGND